MAVVESAEPCGGAELQRAVRAGLRFEAPTREIVGAGGDENAFGDFERDEKRFAARRPGKFETIAGFKAQINGRHEIFPRFDDAARVGEGAILFFKKTLRNPLNGPAFWGTG